MKIKWVSSKKQNEWESPPTLFEENDRKSKKKSVSFENKGSGVVYA